ncbi:MAG: velvet factor-domain-containing protein [Benjaminiella poitrasii]|nr:MAG: velvet factor-domain-containing protein [Benjaminiella poitrasii]
MIQEKNEDIIVPPPFGLNRPSKEDVKYKLIVVQNPVKARYCGFGEKDRRLLDPAPIVQVTASLYGEDIMLTSSDATLFTVLCDLYSEDRSQERGFVYYPPGIYFVFSDLSVRTEGTYTLRFLFSDLSAGDPLTMSTSVLVETYSTPFTVYSPKNFQGMSAATELSKCFANQGVKIITRDNQKKRNYIN